MTDEVEQQEQITPLVPPTPVLAAPMHASPRQLHGVAWLQGGMLLFFVACLTFYIFRSHAFGKTGLIRWYFLYAPLAGILAHSFLLGLLLARKRLNNRVLLLVAAVIAIQAAIPVLMLTIPYAYIVPVARWTTEELLSCFTPIPLYLVLNGVAYGLACRAERREALL
jgi:glucan phosphoethanolaminetransferase (alkaline phosphatase superfamily)